MKIIFFGTGGFCLPVFKKLLKSRHEILAIVTQPDKRKGRGWNVQISSLKALAEKTLPGIKIFQPEKLTDNGFIDIFKPAAIDADIFVVIDYGRLLPLEVLSLARRYCINLHPSLLPKYRGASPINRAILNGERETGVTIIKMNECMDSGDILMQEKVTIEEKDDSVSLTEKLSQKGSWLMLKALDAIESGRATFIKQNEKEATYAAKLEKGEGKIDWSMSAEKINRKIKALQPWPGAFTRLNNRRLKIFEAEVVETRDVCDNPGAICGGDNLFLVSTGNKNIRIIRLQIEGKKVMTAKEFLKGHKLKKGEVLGQ